jgi:hypothetical protein
MHETKPRSYAYLFLVPLAALLLAFLVEGDWVIEVVLYSFMAVVILGLVIQFATGRALDRAWRASISRSEKPVLYWIIAAAGVFVLGFLMYVAWFVNGIGD